MQQVLPNWGQEVVYQTGRKGEQSGVESNVSRRSFRLKLPGSVPEEDLTGTFLAGQLSAVSGHKSKCTPSFRIVTHAPGDRSCKFCRVSFRRTTLLALRVVTENGVFIATETHL